MVHGTIPSILLFLALFVAIAFVGEAIRKHGGK